MSHIVPQVAMCCRRSGTHMFVAAASALLLLALALPVCAFAQDEATLVWNQSSGNTYATLADAVADAQDGDCLDVLADLDIAETISVETSIEIDLNGHEVHYDVPDAGASATTSVLAFSGPRVSCLKNGTLTVESKDPDLSFSAPFSLRAVEVNSRGGLTLSNVHIDAFSNQLKIAASQIQIIGVEVLNGTVRLENATSVDIEANGAFPTEIYGVRTSGAPDTRINLSVSEDSAVLLQNHTDRTDAGAVRNGASLTSINDALLMEFYPENDSALRQSLVDAFTLWAKADFESDDEGKVHDLGLYYASPMKVLLDEGAYYVWAFSAPVSIENKGLKDQIVPVRFFGQSYYDKMPLTYGVLAETGEGAEGSIAIKGEVRALSSRGDAIAVSARGKSHIAIEPSARLTASGTAEPHRAVVGGLSVADLIPSASCDLGFYPDRITAQEVRWVQAQSLCADGDGVVGEEEAACSQSAPGEAVVRHTEIPEDGKLDAQTDPEKVSIKLYHWKPLGSQTVYSYTQKSLSYGASVQDMADALTSLSAVSYHGDKVEEFLGWSTRRTDKEPLFASELPPATEAANYFAIYRTRERKVSVTFMVDGAPYAVAEGVNAGRTVNQAFKESTNSKRPGADAAGNAFRGWSQTPGGKPVTHLVTTLADLAEGEEPLTLYAVYYEPVQAAGAGTATQKPPKPAGQKPSGVAKPAIAPKTPAIARPKVAPALHPLADTDDGGLVALLLDEGAQEQAASDGGAGVTAGSGDANAGEAAGELIADGATPESAPLSVNTVGFFAFVVAALGAVGAGVFRVLRNRRLDGQLDYYEPELAGPREVCF